MTWLNPVQLPALSKGSLWDSALQEQVSPCESPGAAAAKQEGGSRTHLCTHTLLQGQERTETGMPSM